MKKYFFLCVFSFVLKREQKKTKNTWTYVVLSRDIFCLPREEEEEEEDKEDQKECFFFLKFEKKPLFFFLIKCLYGVFSSSVFRVSNDVKGVCTFSLEEEEDDDDDETFLV